MPFIGRDWRANGEQWTKSEIGSWQRLRPISISNSSISSNASLSDIFNALDIANSVSNIRRFNYIAKVVQILFKEKLRELSGNAQRCLLQIIERMIDISIKTGDNIPLMKRIVTQFHNSIHSAYPFFYYIGSAALWHQHIETLKCMKDRLKQAKLNQLNINDDSMKLKFDFLPIEIQREIIHRLDNGADIINIGMINSNLYRVTQELILWRQLCIYHFGDEKQNNKKTILGEKILGLLRRQKSDVDTDSIDWKKVYFQLKKHYNHRDVYAEMIQQCQLCKNLFWQDSVHSCPYAKLPASSKPITPRKLVFMLI